jgi:hypothetical protein
MVSGHLGSLAGLDFPRKLRGKFLQNLADHGDSPLVRATDECAVGLGARPEPHAPLVLSKEGNMPLAKSISN